MRERLKTKDKSEVFWKINTNYSNFMDGFKLLRRRYISFTKKGEHFASNNFLKCAQVKKLKCVTLFSYEHNKNSRLGYKLGHFVKKMPNFAGN